MTIFTIGLGLRKFGAAALRFLLSPPGLILLAVLGVLLTGWLYGNARFAAGDRAGAARVQATIDAPKIGWKARLADCHGNVDRLNASLTAQNAALKANSTADAARLAEATKAISAATQATAKAEAKAKALKRPLTGKTQCDRLLEVDARLMESLR